MTLFDLQVAISVGTKDLADPSLSTLQDASLGEVRRKNAGVLKPKAVALAAMCQYLISQRKTVLLLMPPYGSDRVEVHKQWEELVAQETATLPTAFFRLIDLPSVMCVRNPWNSLDQIFI